MKTLIALLLISASAFAQTAPSPTPPQGPLLERAPVPSQWTVAYKSQHGKQLLAVTKQQDLICETLTNEHGGVIETWHVSGAAVTKAGGAPWQFLPGIDNNFESIDYSKSDFAGFDWISTANFIGMQDVQGKHCLVFADNVLTMDPREVASIQALKLKEYGDNMMGAKIAKREKAPSHQADTPLPDAPVFDSDQHKVRVVAHVDDATRLPVMLTYGTGDATTVRTYQFQPASTPLVIPPEPRKILESQKALQQRQSKPIAPI